MKFTRIIAVAAVMLLSAGTAGAQVNCTGTALGIAAGTCLVTNTVTTTVPYVARLTLSSAATTLTAPTAADFNTVAGVNTAAAVTLDVKSNSSYTVTASAATANFSGGSTLKPASSLSFTKDAFATSTALSVAGSALGTGAAATAGTLYTIGYKTRYDWLQDTPGTYTLAINYTLTAP